MIRSSASDLARPRLIVARRFARAAAAGHVQLHYQPIVSLKDGSIAAAEALLRWRTEDGWLLPGAFLPSLQGRRASARLHAFVVDAATAQARAWEREGRSIQVTINVAPRAVDRELIEHVRRALSRTGLTPCPHHQTPRRP